MMPVWMYAGWVVGGGVVGWGTLAVSRRRLAKTTSSAASETKLWAGILVFAALGFMRWPALVGIGWLLHMAWDGVVHSGPSTYVPSWYVPGCLGFDLVVGTALLLAWYRSTRPPT